MGMAQGTYHVFNAAKNRVLKALFDAYPNNLTSPQISQITGMDYFKVSRLMNHYAASPSRYIRRLKVKGANGAYRYKLNKKGYRYLKDFTMRIKLGVGLNRKKKKFVYMDTYTGHKSVKIRSSADLELTPEQLAPYIRISKKGSTELGVQPEDKLRIVGVIRDNEEGKENEPQVKRKRGRPRKNALEPKTTKAKAKPSTKQEKPVEQPVKSPKKPVEKPAKRKSKEKVKEKVKEKQYVIPDLEEMQVLEIPIKTYTLANGKTVTSKDLAENIVFGLNHINQHIQKTYDKNNMHRLQDKKRGLLVFLNENRDVAQFVDIKKE